MKHTKKRNIKTMRHINKLEAAVHLPVVTAHNCRSLLHKLNNFIQDMRMHNIALAFSSEMWWKDDKNKHIKEVERMSQQEGL